MHRREVGKRVEVYAAEKQITLSDAVAEIAQDEKGK
jgi:hypothetical protein